jgi:ATP/maltotriose-dependent transcriptional regulator MalT
MAELICNATHDLPLEVFDGLQLLLDKSLVYQQIGLDGEPRFLMLETINEYAAERLDQRGETETLRLAHAEHYFALVQLAESHFFGSEQNVWFDRMEAELDNLRAALAWCEASDEGAAIGLQIAGRLWRFWAARGYVTEGRTWLDVLLSHKHSVPKSAVWFALHTAGNLADDHGDFAQARVFWEECLQICRELGNTRFVGHMLNNLGEIALVESNYAQANALYAEALTMYREANNAWAIGLASRNLAKVAHIRGEYHRAQELLSEAIGLMRQRGDKEAAASTMEQLGSLAYDTRDNQAAREHFEQAERLFREVGSKTGLAFVLGNLGELARHGGDYPRAVALLEQSLALQREAGSKEGVAAALFFFGHVAYDQGDYLTARANYHESMQIQHSIGNKLSVVTLIEAFAKLAFAEQHALGAVALLGAASALRQSIGAPLSPREHAWHQQFSVTLRQAFDAATFDAIWQHGQRLSLEEAIALGLAPEQARQGELQHTVRPEPTPATKPRDLMGLTAREVDVLRLVAQGMTDAEVSEKLVISPRTVNGHLSSIYSKLQGYSGTAALRFAREQKHL